MAIIQTISPETAEGEIKSPDAVEQQDMDQLHDMGWTDRDILDALVHGTNMVGASILMKTFKMDMVC